jgi:hypothetical protein
MKTFGNFYRQETNLWTEFLYSVWSKKWKNLIHLIYSIHSLNSFTRTVERQVGRTAVLLDAHITMYHGLASKWGNSVLSAVVTKNYPLHSAWSYTPTVVFDIGTVQTSTDLECKINKAPLFMLVVMMSRTTVWAIHGNNGWRTSAHGCIVLATAVEPVAAETACDNPHAMPFISL